MLKIKTVSYYLGKQYNITESIASFFPKLVNMGIRN